MMPDMGQPEFAAELALHRQRSGYSQTQAATLAGISASLWRQMERPDREYKARRDSVLKAAATVGWNLDEALRLAGWEHPATEQERASLRLGPRDELLRLVSQLTEAQVRALLHAAWVMAHPDVPWPTPGGGSTEGTGRPMWTMLADPAPPTEHRPQLRECRDRDRDGC